MSLGHTESSSMSFSESSGVFFIKFRLCAEELGGPKLCDFCFVKSHVARLPEIDSETLGLVTFVKTDFVSLLSSLSQ